MDDDYREISIANNTQPADNSLATDLNGSLNESPNKSRYGRLHKPKRSQDFCDIDLAIDTSEDHKPNVSASPSKKNYQLCVPLSNETHKSPVPSSPKPSIYSTLTKITAYKSPSPRKFFKRESTSVQQENQDLESDDVNKVLKIISTKPLDSIQDNTKSTPKSALKTYSNKKKLLNKVALVESFGLPDTPIFPIGSSNLTICEPTLDIAPTTLEDDIDKQLLNVPWSLDQINTETNYKNEYNAVEPQPSTSSSLNRIDFYKVSPVKRDPEPITKSITPIKSFSTKIIEQTLKHSDVTIKSPKIKKQSISNSKKAVTPRITKKGQDKVLNGKNKINKVKKSEVEKDTLEIAKENKTIVEEKLDQVANTVNNESTKKVSVLSKDKGTPELENLQTVLPINLEIQQKGDSNSFKGFPKQSSAEITDQTLDFVKILESSIKKNIFKKKIDLIKTIDLAKVEEKSTTETLDDQMIVESANCNLEEKTSEGLDVLTDNCQNADATDKLTKIENITSETKDFEQKVEEKIKSHKKSKIPKTASSTIKSNKKFLLSKLEKVDNLEQKRSKLKKIKENDNNKTEKEGITQKSVQDLPKRKKDPLRKLSQVKRVTVRSSPRIQKDVSNINTEINNDKNILKTKNDLESDRRKSLRVRNDRIDLKAEDIKLMKKLVLEKDENETKSENVSSDISNVSETKVQKNKMKHDRKDESSNPAPANLMNEIPDDKHSTTSEIDKRKSFRSRKEGNISTVLLEQDTKKRPLKLRANLLDNSLETNKLEPQTDVPFLSSSIENIDEDDVNKLKSVKLGRPRKKESVKYKTQNLSFFNSSLESNSKDDLNLNNGLKSFKRVKDKTRKINTSSIESMDEDILLASDKRKSLRGQKEVTKNLNMTDSLNLNIGTENNDDDLPLANDRRKSLRNKKDVTENVKAVNTRNESVDEDFLLANDRRKSLRSKDIKIQEVITTESLISSIDSIDEDLLSVNDKRKSLKNKKDVTESIKYEVEDFSSSNIGSIEDDLILINKRRKSLRNQKEVMDSLIDENTSTEIVDEDFAVNERRKSLRRKDEPTERETQKILSSVTQPDIVNVKTNATKKRKSLKIKESEHDAVLGAQSNEDLNISKNEKKLPRAHKQSLKLAELEKGPEPLELEEVPITSISKNKKKLSRGSKQLLDKLPKLEKSPKSFEPQSQIETPLKCENIITNYKQEKVSPKFETYNIIEDQIHIKKHFKSKMYVPLQQLRNLGSYNSESCSIDSDDDETILSVIKKRKIDKEDLTIVEHSVDIKPKEESNVSPKIPEIHIVQKENVENSSTVDLPSNAEEESLDQKVESKVETKIEVQDVDNDSKLDSSEKDKAENMEYGLGDLIWARIGSYPYWPCMIYADPATNKYKMNIGTIRQKPSYHLRFFGDKGRRSWAFSTSIMPYTDKNDIKILMQKWKHNSKVYQKYIIKPYLLPKLQNAIEEAESLKSSTVEERFEFFFNMFADEAEKKARLKQEDKNSEVTPVEQKGKKLKLKPPKSKLSLPEVEQSLSQKSKKVKLNKSEDSANENMEHNSITDTPTSQKSLGEKSSNLLDDLGDSFQRNSWQGIELRNKHIVTHLNEVNSECSFSDSDTISKSSSNVSTNDLFKVEIVRYKKRSIFKGVSRDRVCQVCNKPGDIFKCKGPCGGLFHLDCAKISSVEVKQEKLEAIEIEMTENVAVSNILSSEINNSCGDVEIIEIDSDSDSSDYSHMLTTKVNVMSNEDFKRLSLPEKIDLKMQELMETVEKKTRYADSTTDEGSSEESICDPSQETSKSEGLVIQHVTADSIVFSSPGGTPVEDNIQKRKKVKATTKQKRIISNEPSPIANVNEDTCKDENKDFKCNYCSGGLDPPCHICHKQISSKNDTVLQKCSLHMCGKFYHPQCLKKLWPQTQWSLISTAKHKNSDEQLDTFVCPMHVCHTCISDNPRAASSRCSSSKVVRCLQCPATYHSTNYCVPAGTEILSCSDVICPRHFVKDDTINTPWCFVCSEGGELICCETCPTSVHSDCLHINFLDDDTFVCEDCESGRFPLYDEVVWVKLGSYRWWPAVILFPSEVPDSINNVAHVTGQFVVKFFGTHDYFWVSKGRVFLFQEGDRGYTSSTKNRVNSIFKTSIEEASRAHEFKKLFKLNQAAEIKIDNKPPPYVRIKMNRPVGNVRQIDANISNTTPCECNPNQPNPCGADSYCINRLLWTECDPNVCPAQKKCCNQRFEKREYPPLVPHRTETRGWGLKTLAAINKGDFVIEYVGEVIDDQEYQRRILKMHEQKDENYYFLTIDKDRIIDAGPKGNLARFMNHCCQPNCETQKWTVNGDTRVGLFAFVDIPEGSELTFNYNLECVGTEKKICNCGAPNCSGFIGVKVKQDESQKKSRKSTNSAKKKKASPPQIPKNEGPCFICKETGDVGTCHNKICNKFYHLQCVNLEFWPEGKWACPWHNCNVCTKRTIRCCVKCINSYCPVHSEGNVRYDKLLGFVCSEHDPTKESHELETPIIIKSNSSSVLTTEETDITSTTSEEMVTSANSSCDLNVTENVESTSIDSLTSTPKQSTDDRQSSSEEDEGKLGKQIKSPSNRKRKARQSGGGRQRKKIKLVNQSLSPAKSKPKPNSISLVSMSIQNEIKLSSTVPVRHLRTTRNSPHLNVEVERFLKHQNEVEKGLPFRKRSRLRYENNL